MRAASLGAPWVQAEVTWATLLLLKSPQMGAPLFLESLEANTQSTSCSPTARMVRLSQSPVLLFVFQSAGIFCGAFETSQQALISSELNLIPPLHLPLHESPWEWQEVHLRAQASRDVRMLL